MAGIPHAYKDVADTGYRLTHKLASCTAGLVKVIHDSWYSALIPTKCGVHGEEMHQPLQLS